MVSERAKELWADFLRYLREAAIEWLDNFDDSPPSHVYTAMLGALVAKVIGWLL